MNTRLIFLPPGFKFRGCGVDTAVAPEERRDLKTKSGKLYTTTKKICIGE